MAQAMATGQVMAEAQMVVVAAIATVMRLTALLETALVLMPSPALNWKARIPLHSHHPA